MDIIQQIKKNDELQEFSLTGNINETYFIDSEGRQLSFGWDKYSGRLNDHRIIFGLLGIERNNFKQLIQETKLLVYMPEANEALFLEGLELSEKQRALIKKHDIEIILE